MPILPKLLLLAVFVVQAAWICWLPLPDLVALIPDDSFFYLRIAQQWWQCGEFSFDGRNPTYGFQPLWQLLLILLQPCCGGPHQFLLLTVLLTALLHTATGAILWQIGKRIGGSPAAWAAAILWLANPALWVWSWGIKENPLYALCWALALRNLHQQIAAGAELRRAVWLGLWLGLGILARVNALMGAGLLLGALAMAGTAGSLALRLRSVLVAAAVATLVAGPWYWFAWLHFGAAMPTSGSWKMLIMQGEMQFRRQLPWLGAGHWWHALQALPAYLRFLVGHGYGQFEAVLALLLPAGLLARWLGAGPGPLGSWWVPAVAVTAGLLSAFANVLVLEVYLSYANWYAVPEYVAVPLLGGLLLATLWRAVQRWRWRLPLVALLGAAAMAWTPPAGLADRLTRNLLQSPPQLQQLLEMGLWLRRQLPPQAAIGCWDPGIVSYFRGGTTVSFDPLMNSLEYQRGFLADPLGFPNRYVEQQQIGYLVGAGLPGQPSGFGALPPAPGGPDPACEVVWQPYPDFDLGWSERRWFLVVRPLATEQPAWLAQVDFPFGIVYPNDPARRRIATGDRDRLCAGLEWQADVLRLQLELPAGAEVALQAGSKRLRFTAADRGWQCLDARSWRGQQVQLLVAPELLNAVPQAQILDYTLP